MLAADYVIKWNTEEQNSKQILLNNYTLVSLRPIIFPNTDVIFMILLQAHTA
jgi:hypothetical protein